MPDAPGASLQLVSLVAEGGIITAIVAAIYRTRQQKERAVQRAERLQALTAGLAAARSPTEVADVVIDNSGSLDELSGQVDRFWADRVAPTLA